MTKTHTNPIGRSFVDYIEREIIHGHNNIETDSDRIRHEQFYIGFLSALYLCEKITLAEKCRLEKQI